MDQLLLPPDEHLAELIKKDINEIDDQKLEHNIRLIEDWAMHQPHLPKNYEKNIIDVYLRGSKHNLEVTKRKIEFFFIFKSQAPHLFQFQPFTEDDLKTIRNCIVAPMPHLTDDGYRLVVCRLKDSSLDLYDINILMKYFWKLGHLKVLQETLIAGDIYIFDCKNFTPAHLTKIITPDFKNTIHFIQEGHASRIKQVIIVNAPAYAEKFVDVVKMLFKEKMRLRFVVDQGYSSLKTHISEKSLPKDYGGSGEYTDDVHTKWMKCLDDYESWFKEQENVKLVGDIPKNKLNFNYDYGVEGSFRQLSID